MRSVLAGVMLCGIAVGSGWTLTPEEQFARANEYYEAKQYEGAIDRYHKVLSSGIESPDIFFNLGNAYFKNGDLGHAVLYYMKARRLDPGDADIQHNLEFARQFSPVQMEGVSLNPIHGFFESITRSYRLNTLGWIASILYILFMVSLMLRFGLGMRGSSIKSFVIVSCVVFLVAAGLTTFKYQNEYLTQRAVILADDSPVRTGPSDQSEVELQGAPGLVVEIVDEHDEYYSVLFENKRRGWINKDLVALI